jgi:arabinogalactan oligomer/maltooligosaccharide transport system substrate-binding protein
VLYNFANERNFFMKLSRNIIIPVFALLVVACASTETPSVSSSQSDRINLKIWAAEDDLPLYQTMAEEFKLLYPQFNYRFTWGNVGEDIGTTTVLEDLDVAADVFTFADDQIGRLVTNGALAELTGTLKERITTRNTTASVASSTVGGKMYAYPSTADNGYFLYYNASQFTSNDLLTLDGIMAKTTANKQLILDIPNSYYTASFFMDSSELSYDPVLKRTTITFNDQKGLESARGVTRFTTTHNGVGLLSANVDDNINLLASGAAIAAVSGTWNAEAIEEALGSNYAATKLPTFNAVLDNGSLEARQMVSFSGAKLIGVKSTSTVLSHAQAFADYLTTEDNQLIRFNARSLGPSNLEALQDPAVLANVALTALNQQNVFSKPQAFAAGGQFWAPIGALGTFLLTPPTDFTDVEIQDALDAAVNAIELAESV